MRNFRKILAVILALVMCLSLAACGGEKGDNGGAASQTTTNQTDTGSKQSDDKGQAAATETPEEPEEPEEPEFVIDRSKTVYKDEDGIYRYSANDEIVSLGTPDAPMEIIVGDHWSTDSEPSTAQEIATAEYREEIMELYNFTIKQTKVCSYGDMEEFVNNFCQTGGDENYVFVMANNWITTPMRNHLFFDLSKLDCLDFSEKKWDKSTCDKTTLQGAVYAMRAEAAEPRGGVYFNKRLLTEAGVDPDSLYDMQADGTWTWDAFEKLCDKLTRDTDGDGIKDVFAMSSFNGDLMNSVCASNGAQIISIDENGNFINTTNTNEFLQAYDWAHNLRQLYEAPQPEDTEWNYSYDLFLDAKVPLIVSEFYKCSTFNKEMEDDFGFVVFPKGPAVDDYNGYSTDNMYIIPGIYDDERAWKIAFAYNLFTEPTPGYEDDDDWKTYYYTVARDERTVDETLAILRDHQEACIYPLVPNVNHDNNYWWNIDAETGAERYETMKDEIQALLDAVNK